MNEHLQELAGIVIAGVLAVDGLLHAYWATGQIWPARNKLSLVRAVLNISNTRAFRPAILLPLAVLLACGALIVLARVHQLGMPGQLIPDSLLQLGIVAVAMGLLVRGVAGIGWALGLAPTRSKLFYRLNLLVYTPVCLVLFIAAVAVASS
jgi:4,5:9,10-diseco-3-hydroxy-5,9,17-trioxoandrosta-1(10),2-diene-4-oate hydrolase